MADGEEIKREHLEGDREEGRVKGPGCRTILEDSAKKPSCCDPRLWVGKEVLVKVLLV